MERVLDAYEELKPGVRLTHAVMAEVRAAAEAPATRFPWKALLAGAGLGLVLVVLLALVFDWSGTTGGELAGRFARALVDEPRLLWLLGALAATSLLAWLPFELVEA